MNNYDFSGLTLAQKNLLTFQGWSVSMAGIFNQPTKRVVEKLIERGLVVERINRDRMFTVLEYEVPIPVHMAWCELCSAVEEKRA